MLLDVVNIFAPKNPTNDRETASKTEDYNLLILK